MIQNTSWITNNKNLSDFNIKLILKPTGIFNLIYRKNLVYNIVFKYNTSVTLCETSFAYWVFSFVNNCIWYDMRMCHTSSNRYNFFDVALVTTIFLPPRRKISWHIQELCNFDYQLCGLDSWDRHCAIVLAASTGDIAMYANSDSNLLIYLGEKENIKPILKYKRELLKKSLGARITITKIPRHNHWH